jgi:hypothetical protein
MGLMREIGIHLAKIRVALLQAVPETSNVGATKAELAGSAQQLHTRTLRG